MVNKLESSGQLLQLEPGQPIIYGSNKFSTVDADLARKFVAGDRIVVDDFTGELLHIPEAEYQIAFDAITSASDAFAQLNQADEQQIDSFFNTFADALGDAAIQQAIFEANEQDITRAQEKGRSTTRLELSQAMLQDMVTGLKVWPQMEPTRDKTLRTIEHKGWTLEQKRSGLGVVAFVFEGRPNVFADACGVIKSGNTAVLRIGSDALTTAREIMEKALRPSLETAGLPAGSVNLIDSTAHAAGWAMFNDARLALAVARGSGPAVAQLGSVARQAGNPVSLHGTGGAWIVAGEHCDSARLAKIVENSLDRKVCNTLNTCCIPWSQADTLVPSVLAAVESAAAMRSTNPKIHLATSPDVDVVERLGDLVPTAWLEEKVEISRAAGPSLETRVSLIGNDQLGVEWEWENSPEITLNIVSSVQQAVDCFNSQAPRFVASLISESHEEQQSFWKTVDAPFVGDGFTRWVDGQYALNQPELGLSNWQSGRLFGRGGILSGDSLFTIRTKMVQHDPQVSR